MFGVSTPQDILIRVGGAVAMIAMVGGLSYCQGRTDGKNAEQAKQLRVMNKAIVAIGKGRKAMAALSQARAEAERNRQTIVREFYREVPTIVRDPVYRSICVDDSGVRHLDRLVSSANGDPGRPAGEAGEDPGRAADGRSEDRQVHHDR
jgi:hypothetical protein